LLSVSLWRRPVPVLGACSLLVSSAAYLFDKAWGALSYSPPAFGLARSLMIGSALLMAGVAISVTALLRVDASVQIRALVGSLAVLLIGSLLFAGLIWVRWRESDFEANNRLSVRADRDALSPTVRQVPPSFTAAPATTPTTGPPIVGNIAATTSIASSTTSAPEQEPADESEGSHLKPFTVEVGQLTKLYLPPHTQVEGDALVARLIGKWLRIAGPVLEVKNDVGGEIKVLIRIKASREHPIVASLGFTNSAEAKRASVLRYDERIEAIGKLRWVSDASVGLDNCDLVRP
jgi:hypothetical protein